MLSLAIGQRGGNDVFHGLGIALRGAVPHTPAEGGDVNPIAILRVGNDPVTPLEIVTANAFPGFAAVEGAPGGRLEPTGIENLRIAGINRDVVNVLVMG